MYTETLHILWYFTRNHPIINVYPMQKDAAKKLEMLLCEPQLIEPTGSEVYEAVLFCFFFKKP